MPASSSWTSRPRASPSPRRSASSQVIADLKATASASSSSRTASTRSSSAPTASSCCATARVVGELAARRDPSRRDDPPDDRPRPARRSTRRPRRRRARRSLEIDDLRTPAYPRPCGQPGAPARRDPRPCRPRRRRAHRARPRGVRHRPGSSAAALRLDGRADRRRLAARRHRRVASTSCPEDRKRSGLMLEDSIAENISLADLATLCPRRPARRRRARAANAEGSAAPLRIKTPIRSTIAVGTLSGGNQQKVVLAKWLSMKPQGDHLRRADARHRRRRQERDL